MAAGENTQVGKAQLDDELLSSQAHFEFDTPAGGEKRYLAIHAFSALSVEAVQCKTSAGTAEISVQINDSATPVDFDADGTGVVTSEGYLEADTTKEGYTASGGTSLGGDENLVAAGQSVSVTVENASSDVGTVYVDLKAQFQRAPE